MKKAQTLSPEHQAWIASLEALEAHCKKASDNDCEHLAVRLFKAICAAPEPIHILLGSHCEEKFFDRFIDAQAYDCAVLAMLGAKTGYVISRSPEGHYIATVHLPTWVDEYSFYAESLCVCLVGALSGALSKILIERPSALIELAGSKKN